MFSLMSVMFALMKTFMSDHFTRECFTLENTFTCKEDSGVKIAAGVQAVHLAIPSRLAYSWDRPSADPHNS